MHIRGFWRVDLASSTRLRGASKQVNDQSIHMLQLVRTTNLSYFIKVPVIEQVDLPGIIHEGVQQKGFLVRCFIWEQVILLTGLL